MGSVETPPALVAVDVVAGEGCVAPFLSAAAALASTAAVGAGGAAVARIIVVEWGGGCGGEGLLGWGGCVDAATATQAASCWSWSCAVMCEKRGQEVRSSGSKLYLKKGCGVRYGCRSVWGCGQR